MRLIGFPMDHSKCNKVEHVVAWHHVQRSAFISIQFRKRKKKRNLMLSTSKWDRIPRMKRELQPETDAFAMHREQHSFIKMTTTKKKERFTMAKMSNSKLKTMYTLCATNYIVSNCFKEPFCSFLLVFLVVGYCVLLCFLLHFSAQPLEMRIIIAFVRVEMSIRLIQCKVEEIFISFSFLRFVQNKRRRWWWKKKWIVIVMES